MKVYMGMCSWTDPDLVKSKKYYPPSVHKSDDMLKYYASQFPCVEIDSSAYAMPPKKSTTKWAQLVPSNFRFHVKAYNLFTQLSADFATLPVEIKAELQKSRHQSKLPEFGPHDKVEWKKLPRSARDLIWSYFINNTLLPLQKSGKLVAVLFQFPKSFSPHSKGWSLSVDTNFQQRNNLQLQQQQLGDDDDDDEYGIAEKQQPDATVKSEKDKAKSTTTPTPAATATATATAAAVAAAAADEQEESSGQFISQAHIIECRDRLASVGINNMTVELRNVRWLNEENRERTIKFLTDNRIGMVCLDEFDVSDEGAPAATTSTTSAAPTTAASSSSSSATPKFAPASTIKTKANSDNKAVTVSNSSVISSSSSSSDDNDDPTTNPSTNDTMVRGRKREFPLILQDTTQGKFLYTRIHRRAGTHRLLSQTELNQWKRRLERLAEAVSEAGTTTTAAAAAAAAAALASAQTAATSSASKQVSSGSDFAVYMLWNTNHEDHGIINARRMAKLLGPELCPKWQPHSDLLSMFQKQASSKSKVEKQSPTPTDSALPQPHTTTITTTAINRIPDTPSDKKRARAEEEEDEEANKPERNLGLEGSTEATPAVAAANHYHKRPRRSSVATKATSSNKVVEGSHQAKHHQQQQQPSITSFFNKKSKPNST